MWRSGGPGNIFVSSLAFLSGSTAGSSGGGIYSQAVDLPCSPFAGQPDNGENRRDFPARSAAISCLDPGSHAGMGISGVEFNPERRGPQPVNLGKGLSRAANVVVCVSEK